MLLLWIVAGFVALALACRLAARLGAARDRRRFPARGRMLMVGNRRLHALLEAPAVVPHGAPTVVLEAALGGSSLGWCRVQPRLAEFLPTLSYDRAGLGWSDAAPEPPLIERALGDLRGVLAAAGCRPPYLFVGHSYGGWIVRLFAARYPGEVAGLVLVDSPDPAIWAAPDPARVAKLAAAARLARRGGWAARSGIGRLIAALLTVGALPLARFAVRLASGGQLLGRNPAPDARRPWGGLATFAPLLKLPPELRQSLRAAWLRPAFYDAVAGVVSALPESAALIAAAPLPPGLPLAVLTAADADADHLRHHRDLGQGPGCHHATADSGGHWIPLESPELVVDAVRRVLASSRVMSTPDERRRA